MSQMKGSKNIGKMAFFLLPLGIAVNFIGGQVATLLNLPIYLDAIGTMVVAALCGPIYSVATALITGLLMSITAPTNLIYIGNYLAVGLFSGLFSYWGFFKNVWKSCIAGAVSRPVLRHCRLYCHCSRAGRLQRQHPRYHHRLSRPDVFSVHPGS